MDFFFIFLSILVLLVFVLVGVAFLTLLERKILGYIQIRKGPNKVGYLGLLQPFSDAIKLFSKEGASPFMANFYIYYFSPVFNLFLSLFLWMCIPFFSGVISFDYSVLFFFSVSSIGVYSVMLAGWSSNSNYSLLGSLRSVAQTVSYEVSMFLIFLSFLFLVGGLNLIEFMNMQIYIWNLFLFFPLVLMWIVSSLAETNRTPFDFAEGESELVSGFNVEYSSGGFAMIFLAEYSSILFLCVICSLIFLGGDIYSWLFFLKVSIMSFLWVWVRGTLPRYRYDKLMGLAWKLYLPISLNFIMLYLGFSFLFNSFIF